ncbi:hypothetical protein Tco_1149067 [Tanacetum coccineum]
MDFIDGQPMSRCITFKMVIGDKLRNGLGNGTGGTECTPIVVSGDPLTRTYTWSYPKEVIDYLYLAPNGTEYIGGSVVPEEDTEEVVQQPEPELRKSKRNRTPKNFGPEFQLYLIEGTRDEVSNQHSYCFNFEDDPKTFDEAMKSQDVAFWKG